MPSNVRPTQPFDDPMDRLHGQSIFISNHLECHDSTNILMTNGQYNFVCQFCSTIGHAFRSIVVRLTAFLAHVSMIIGRCSSEQMCRIAARRIVASMTDEFTFCNRPIGQFKCNAMSAKQLVSISAHASISSIIDIRLPFPAFIGFSALNTRPESVCINQHRQAMASTKATGLPLDSTFLKRSHRGDRRRLSASTFAQFLLHVMDSNNAMIRRLP